MVVLGGTLANQDAIDHVKDIASKVTGVKSVDTSAVVIASQSLHSMAGDARAGLFQSV